METEFNPEQILLCDSQAFLYERPSLSPEDIQMHTSANFILHYEDPRYNNDESNPKVRKMENLRKRFIIDMKLERLCVQEERVGKHKFIKVSCPLERLYQEAETIRVELPLYGINTVDSAEKEEEAMIEKKMEKILDDRSKNTTISAPFLKDCIDLFRNGENPILWSSIRCYLVSSVTY